MSITIDLPEAIEARLRAHASASGKNLETLVVEAIEAKLSLAQMTFREILAPIHDDFRRSGMSDEELDELLQSERAEARAARASSSPNK